ncbi:Valerianol synthase TPS1G-like protein [Drosera capensis]
MDGAENVPSEQKPCRATVARPLAQFPADVWSDRFLLSNQQDMITKEERVKAYAKEIKPLQEEVRAKLAMDDTDDSVITRVEKMRLIDAVERLGISYHYEKEIEELLPKIFEAYAHDGFHDLEDSDHTDLYTTALVFRVFRQHGYKISCDVFNKFRDSNGKFRETLGDDVKGIISLYEAARLAIHREDVLDQAKIFTTRHLKCLASATGTDEYREPRLMKQVAHALKQPLHYGIPRVESRHFISFYEEDETRDETLLQFAKMDFNMLQLLHQLELSHVCKWWKDFNFVNKLPYVRNRSVECYFWTMGMFFEPRFSRARILLAKVLLAITVLDDTYDAYSTFEEAQLLTNAFERWEISIVDELPDYLKIVFKFVLDIYDEFDLEMAKEGRPYAAYYAKERVKDLIRSYYLEAKWLNAGCVPTFEEYMPNARITSAMQILTTSSFMGMKDIADEEAFQWLNSYPKIISGIEVISRLMDDIVTHEEEQARGHVASGVECYMKEFGMSRGEVVEIFERMISDAWKDVNEEFLRPTPVSGHLLTRPLNLGRVVEALYKHLDGYTYSAQVIKDDIIAAYADPIFQNPICNC